MRAGRGHLCMGASVVRARWANQCVLGTPGAVVTSWVTVTLANTARRKIQFEYEFLERRASDIWHTKSASWRRM